MKDKEFIDAIKDTVNNSLAETNAEEQATTMHELFEAIESLNRNKAESILNAGFNKETRDAQGRTVLCALIEYGSEAVKLAVSLGFDINAKDKKGWTPLFHLRKYADKNTDNILLHKWLISKGAVSIPDQLRDKWEIT